MPGAAAGSSAVPPEKVCPLVTVSRLVPSAWISASSVAWEEAARPSTATIAATPLAMPIAARGPRSLRVRSPTLASPATSPGRDHATPPGVGGPGGRRGPGRAPARAGGGAPAPPPGGADAGVQQPVGHVAQRALVLGEEDRLELEPDPGRPQPGQLPVGHPGRVQAG